MAGVPLQDFGLCSPANARELWLSHGKDLGEQSLKNIHCMYSYIHFYTHLPIFSFAVSETLMSDTSAWECRGSLTWVRQMCRREVDHGVAVAFLTHELPSLIFILLILSPCLCQAGPNMPRAPTDHWPLLLHPEHPRAEPGVWCHFSHCRDHTAIYAFVDLLEETAKT